MSSEQRPTGSAGEGAGEHAPPPSAAGQVTATARTPANRWYRRAPFWRAVAGMAIAIALGCAAIALETISELSSSSRNYHHRLNALSSRISRMRVQVSNEERQLVAMRAERAARESINRVLSAPDATLIRLVPAQPVGSTSGLVAISKKAGKAVLEVAGLPPVKGRNYVMWWMPSRGAPAKAVSFQTSPDERASVVLSMPPRGATINGATVTLEAENAAAQPTGEALLKGAIAKPRVLH